MQREGRLSAAIVKRLNACPGVLVRKRHGSAFAVAGDPDITGCVRGRHLELEVKLPGEEPTVIQRKRLAEWTQAGAIAGVATSVDEALCIAGLHEPPTPGRRRGAWGFSVPKWEADVSA